MDFKIIVATANHTKYAPAISAMISEASRKRGTGIANRTAAYIEQKMQEKHAILALYRGTVAGFCYIETWSHHKYVANSGLIVANHFQHQGLAAKIKTKAFELSKSLYPDSKLFGITTSLPVMKINSALGYKPVTFSELTDDKDFWKGCQGCKNIDILKRNDHKMCLCTGMLYQPNGEIKMAPEPKKKRWKQFKSFFVERAKRLKKLKI
ncbi:N-acetyl-L-citrulline:glutamate N-acetyltransferase [hydrothermal vent metagenome]|uniref:N-acetyl-L-citrulline:glutamate N-acetyltransferase n=1 Tax=hydrothermal vent metagenome TaxID=652676 RepID=A0A3B0UGW2_9ZZZZ